MARAMSSWSNAARSVVAPPPRTTAITSTPIAATRAMAATTLLGASTPWTACVGEDHLERVPARGELVHEIGVRGRTGTGHEPDPQRQRGDDERRVAPQQALGDEELEQQAALLVEPSEGEHRVDGRHHQPQLAAGHPPVDAAADAHLDPVGDPGLPGSVGEHRIDSFLRPSEQRNRHLRRRLLAGRGARFDEVEVAGDPTGSGRAGSGSRPATRSRPGTWL